MCRKAFLDLVDRRTDLIMEKAGTRNRKLLPKRICPGIRFSRRAKTLF